MVTWVSRLFGTTPGCLGNSPVTSSVQAALQEVAMLVRDLMQTEVVTILANQTVPDAVVRMGTLEARRLLVTEDGRLVGLLTAAAITRTLQESSGPQTPWSIVFQAASTRVRDVMTPEVYTVLETDDLRLAIASFLEHHVGGLPVLGEGGSLGGILTLTDVLKAAARGSQPGWGLVRDHMSAEVLSVTAQTPLAEAAARMTVTRLRVMPVVAGAGPSIHGEGGQVQEGAATRSPVLLGVLHQRDIRAATAHAEGGHGPTIMGGRFFLGAQTARDLMRPPSATILADATLTEAVRAMQLADVHGLPVVAGNGDLLGVITVSDVLRAMLGDALPASGASASSFLAHGETHG